MILEITSRRGGLTEWVNSEADPTRFHAEIRRVAALVSRTVEAVREILIRGESVRTEYAFFTLI